MMGDVLRMLFVLTAMAVVSAEDVGSVIALSAHVISDDDSAPELRVIIENVGNKPTRVLRPKFNGFDYSCTHGGIYINALKSDGEFSDVSFFPAFFGAPHLARENDTQVLNPGGGITTRIRIPDKVMDNTNVAKLRVQYVVHGPSAEDQKLTGGGVARMVVEGPALVQGVLLTTEVQIED